ncbi:MAG TPA: DNA adenine methylase [Pyrinomonadaceae bacterium]|jgi:adenine-specific DNA methylase
MIHRYLGNKTEMLEPMMAVIGQHCPPGSRVCDIFSGSLSVSFEFKRRSYSVLANDVNLFSAVVGNAFLVNNKVPAVSLEELTPKKDIVGLRKSAGDWASRLVGGSGFKFLENRRRRTEYVELLALILYLQQLEPGMVPSGWRRSDFFDTYTEEGRNSSFVSQRGRTGRRRFFSGENGRRIDAVLSQIRCWRRNGLLSEVLHSMLLSVLIRAVEKVSNTQGTYHDFPREEIDPRALNPLLLEAPRLDVALAGGKHQVGWEQDSLEFIESAPRHDLLYIDPPYNFRQYTSYYFMPNLLCRYSDIEDLDDYFARVEYVRGQNMDDDFVSPFCKKSLFIESLSTLIGKAKTRLVALSYFDGRNHWNEFKSDANGVGYLKLQEFFNTELFRPGTLKIVPIPRTNYQSYGGYKAREVLEFLFICEKARG